MHRMRIAGTFFALAAVLAAAANTAPSADAVPPERYGRLLYIHPTSDGIDPTFRTSGTQVVVYYSCTGKQSSNPYIRMGLRESLVCDGKTRRAYPKRAGTFGTHPGTNKLYLHQNGTTRTALSVWGLKP
jgi:hypothetical protein